MENPIETQEVQNQDEVENDWYASAGYFVRTDLRAGSKPECDTSGAYVSGNYVNKCVECWG